MGRNASDSTSGEEGELPASPADSKRDDYYYAGQDREKRNRYHSDEDGIQRKEDNGRGHQSQNQDDDETNNDAKNRSRWRGRDDNGGHNNKKAIKEDNDRNDSRHRRREHYDNDNERLHKEREIEERFGAGNRDEGGDRKNRREVKEDGSEKGNERESKKMYREKVREEDSESGDGDRKDRRRAGEGEKDDKREGRRGRDDSGKGRRRRSNEGYRGRGREGYSDGDDDRRKMEKDGGNGWREKNEPNDDKGHIRKRIEERYGSKDKNENSDSDSGKGHKGRSDEGYRGRGRGRGREGDSDGDDDDRKYWRKMEKDGRDGRRGKDERNDDKGHRRKGIEDMDGSRDKNENSDSDLKNRRERERGKRLDDKAKDRQRHRGEMDEKYRRDEKERKNRKKEEIKNVELEIDGGRLNVEPKVVLQPENLGRSGGVYIPPFKLARMMKEVQDKSSLEYQRMTWDALRKSINGLVNKVNAINIKNIIPELFAENLIRGRGLFCRSCMKSQMASPGFTDVFAALVAVANTKFPEVGELLLRRIILRLKSAYKRNDKPQLLAAVKFIAHLVNQQVVHELIALELLTILLENPTDDSVEVAVGFVTECGSMLQDLCPRGLHGIFERFRGILHEGEIDKRVQFLIEGLFALRKSKFQGYPAVRPELDLVEQEDQLTHEISLSDEIDPETALDIFKPDPNFLENEKKYEELKKSILGEESDDEAGSDGESDSEDEEESEEEEERMKIQDETETNLVNLRRTIYLTIMSSVDFEEAGHKLLKIKLEPGQEMELCVMLLECCSQERTYLRYYGLLGQRFCMINKVYQVNFETCFVQQYSMIHRLETNKLRNVAKFFAHLLGTDALPWHVLSYIRLTEEDTTSSSRIFIKILFQELSEHLGIHLLNERLNDPSMQESFDSIFPKDNPKNTRFSINFFTSIGLGGITENLREYLKNMPRLIMQQQKPASESDESGSGSGDSDSSSVSSSSSDESESESDSGKDDKRRKRRRRS